MFDVRTKTSNYMSIVVTDICNMSCPFCIAINSKYGRYIELNNVVEALVYAKEEYIRDILLVGGEPTLHPHIKVIATLANSLGFNVILTTNYTNPDIVKSLDVLVDSFNISFYNQTKLPEQKDYASDLTLSTLIYDGQLDTKQKLDEFIDEYSGRYILKFSTLTVCNDWTAKQYKVPYLNSLDAEYIVLFNEIIGQIYRGCVIKRYDKIVNMKAEQSLKCNVNGRISRSW